MKRLPIPRHHGRPWLRSLLLAMVLAALPFLYLIRDQSSKSGGASGPPSAGGLVRPRYHFSSYDEYVQLQLRKTADPRLRKLWTTRDWRRKVDVFGRVFQRLMKDGLLSPDARALCVAARMGQEVLALRETGVQDAIGIDLLPAPPLVVRGDMHEHPFPDSSFDFEFSNAFDHALYPALFASEMERTLKPGGIAVIHVLVGSRGDKYSANDLDSVDALAALFKQSDLLYSKPVDALGLDTEVAFRRRGQEQQNKHCTVPKVAQETMGRAELLIQEEPLKPWLTFKRNLARMAYLPDIADIGNRSGYVYIDVGSREYGSSIGGWFKKRYPSQGHNFSIYAIEADKSFQPSYARRRDVTLLPYAAWTRDEQLSFAGAGVGDKMGRIVTGAAAQEESSNSMLVQGFDFGAWLRKTVQQNDYVVIKMDVEGAEFELVPRLLETGAACLIDELFLECHYNRWQKCCPGKRSPKYTATYGDCLSLMRRLRASGVLVHQWW